MAAIADVSDRSLVDLISLRGRVAVVTGGGRGLGSGLTDQSQKMTVAARAMAEKKALGHRS